MVVKGVLEENNDMWTFLLLQRTTTGIYNTNVVWFLLDHHRQYKIETSTGGHDVLNNRPNANLNGSFEMPKT